MCVVSAVWCWIDVVCLLTGRQREVWGQRLFARNIIRSSDKHETSFDRCPGLISGYNHLFVSLQHINYCSCCVCFIIDCSTMTTTFDSLAQAFGWLFCVPSTHNFHFSASARSIEALWGAERGISTFGRYVCVLSARKRRKNNPQMEIGWFSSCFVFSISFTQQAWKETSQPDGAMMTKGRWQEIEIETQSSSARDMHHLLVIISLSLRWNAFQFFNS